MAVTEISVYQDGQPLGLTAMHLLTPKQGSFEAVSIPWERSRGVPPDRIVLELAWDGSPMVGWQAVRLSLFDGTGYPMAEVSRPGLLHMAPSDCPSVVLFPARRPLTGMLAVMLRAADPWRTLSNITLTDPAPKK